MIRTLVLVAGIASLCNGATIHGRITEIPKEIAPSGARVSVDGGQLVALVDESGHFALNGLEPGSHIMQVALEDLVFPPIRLDVSEVANRFRAVVNDGSSRTLVNAMSAAAAAEASASSGGDVPVVPISPVGRHKYYVPREHFSVMSIVKNPMVLMMLFSVGMVYIMPLIADQDEMKAQMKDMQKSINQVQGAGAGGKPIAAK